MVDGLSIGAAKGAGIILPLTVYKSNIFSIQKWMFETLNNLEAFLSDFKNQSMMEINNPSNSIGEKKQNLPTDFNKRIYASLGLYNKGIANIEKSESMLTSSDLFSTYGIELLLHKDTLIDILTLEYIKLPGKENELFPIASQHILNSTVKVLEEFENEKEG
mmetsp:Transcript_2622/g.3071  ORF Transcript_2622/g.3071 Transcript_2622/m.3071 type:complete len:162 (-) Transcript_2622:37-522(-)